MHEITHRSFEDSSLGYSGFNEKKTPPSRSVLHLLFIIKCSFFISGFGGVTMLRVLTLICITYFMCNIYYIIECLFSYNKITTGHI